MNTAYESSNIFILGTGDYRPQGWDGLLGYLPTIGLIVAGIHVLEVLLSG